MYLQNSHPCDNKGEIMENRLAILELIDKLYKKNYLEKEQLLYILNHIEVYGKDHLIKRAHETRMKTYGNKVYIRGLIEITNHCKMDCKYCGINIYNKNVDRYRLTLEEILICCELGYRLGYRTFVLQGGEDSYFRDDIIVDIVKSIKSKYPDVAITLSIGEKSYESYKKYYETGVDRYLLRHETASRRLFEKIHISSSYDNRMKSLLNLKEIGYQVGAGFMVGIPDQNKEDLAEDIIFLKKLDPEMVGIGPFIPHRSTIYKSEKSGTLEDTITMLALTRLYLPYVLLPSTTALGSIDPKGREKGLMAGANVIMPNLSPKSVRDKYALYDGKVSFGYEGAESIDCIRSKINSVGFQLDMSRGDNIKWRTNI